MKIEMQMTERDKKLLIFLAIFVIVVGFGYWGIRPSIVSIIESQNEIEVQKEQMILDDIKIAQVGMLEVENSQLEEDILVAREIFYPMMSSSEIDKMMTGMVLGYNLYAYDLVIDIPEDEAIVSAYQYSEKAAEDKMNEELYQAELDAAMDDSADDTSSMYDEVDTYLYAEETEYEQQVSTGVYCAHISMRIGGTEENLKRLINDLSEPEKELHLTAYQWVRGRELVYNEESDDYGISYDIGLIIDLDIYMCAE